MNSKYCFKPFQIKNLNYKSGIQISNVSLSFQLVEGILINDFFKYFRNLNVVSLIFWWHKCQILYFKRPSLWLAQNMVWTNISMPGWTRVPSVQLSFDFFTNQVPNCYFRNLRFLTVNTYYWISIFLKTFWAKDLKNHFPIFTLNRFSYKYILLLLPEQISLFIKK